ncbi:MAG: metal-sensing transcriptional repressor [Candidatus Saccharimonadaceae bacterium]
MQYEVRIKKIIGQLESLARLNKEQDKCEAVLQQINAIQGGVSSLKRLIIDDSLEACGQSTDAHKEAKKLLSNIARYI